MSLEEEIDVTRGRLVLMEKNISIIQENVFTIADQLKETQKYLIKLAHNQSEISKRVTHWPFIAVEKNSGDEYN
jgi:sulfate adenylyltransferase subunit 1 (EFTu-like GTPase family)